jgi:hypothetical protein
VLGVLMSSDEMLVLFIATAVCGFLNPRFGWFVLGLCSVSKFFGG